MSISAPISAEDMAALIVDALVDARLIDGEQFEAAAAIAAREIQIRLELGNFLPSGRT